MTDFCCDKLAVMDRHAHKCAFCETQQLVYYIPNTGPFSSPLLSLSIGWMEKKIAICDQVYVLKKELGLEFPGVCVCCLCVCLSLCVFSSASMGLLHFSNEENPEV